MNRLAWLFQRLRAMGAQEIAHRVKCQVRDRIEQRRVTQGWQPHPRLPVKPAARLFPPIERWTSNFTACFQLDQSTIDDLVRGEIELFGSHRYSLGDPPNWHRDPSTGVVAPRSFGKFLNYRDDRLVGDVKVLWELSRHHHLIPLAVAYAVSGEPRYRDAIVRHIATWIEQNPFGLGIHWSSALEAALRLIAWSMVHHLIAARDGENGLFDAMPAATPLGESIYQQVWSIRHFLSLYSSANNHLIGELTGIWTACKAFDLGAEGTTWATFAKTKLEDEFEKQVFSDGVDKEQALYYHLWVLEYGLFLSAIGAGAQDPFSERFSQRVSAMADFVRDLTPPGGKPPQIGDADDGFVTRFVAAWPGDPFEEVLAAENVVAKRALSHRIVEKAFFYGLLAHQHAPEPIVTRQKCPRTYPKIYPHGGYAILGDEHIHIVFDAGSLGYPAIAAHGHADALSFCLAINGDGWLVDPGTYAYHSLPEWRNYFRGTLAHNTIQIDGEDQSQIAGPFLWLNHAQATLAKPTLRAGLQEIAGTHDGYGKRGVAHKRTIQYAPEQKTLRLFDELAAQGMHSCKIAFHFPPDAVLTAGRNPCEFEISKPNSEHTLRFALPNQCDWQSYRGAEHPIRGWYSNSLGTRQPAWALIGSGHIAAGKTLFECVIEIRSKQHQ